MQLTTSGKRALYEAMNISLLNWHKLQIGIEKEVNKPNVLSDRHASDHLLHGLFLLLLFVIVEFGFELEYFAFLCSREVFRVSHFYIISSVLCSFCVLYVVFYLKLSYQTHTIGLNRYILVIFYLINN